MNLKRTIATCAIAVVMELALLGARSQAALLNYEFVLYQPLPLFAESIGGPASPITFNFFVDLNATSLHATEGYYTFGYESPGYATVTVGGTVSPLQMGGIQVNSGPLGVGFNAGASGYDTGVRIFGRSLLGSAVSLYDPTGQTFNGVELPMNVQSPFSVYFGLQFRPGPLDANQNEYLKFDAFVHPDNYTSSVTVVAVPLQANTLPMTVVALTGLSWLGYRLKRRRSLHPCGVDKTAAVCG